MKVLIVGLGSIARKHIGALRKIESGAALFALRSNPDAKAEDGITNIFSVAEAQPLQVDFVIVATPTFLHYKNIQELIFLKKPLFIEKPLSDNLEVEKLIPALKQNQIQTYIACNLRFLEALDFVRTHFIKNGYRINEVNVYCGSYLPDWRPLQNFRESYSAYREKGGGVHLDLIHEIDYLFWLFGKPASVTSIKTGNSSLAVDAVDYANYSLQYPSFTASVILNYYRRDAKRTLEVITDKSTIHVDLLKNAVFENGTLVFGSEQRISDTYEKQLRYFSNAVRSKTGNVFNDINEAVEVLKICLA